MNYFGDSVIPLFGVLGHAIGGQAEGFELVFVAVRPAGQLSRLRGSHRQFLLAVDLLGVH